MGGKALKNLDRTRNKNKEGRWEINCDGYYPYCTVCGEEPDTREMSPTCPMCGASLKPFLNKYDEN